MFLEKLQIRYPLQMRSSSFSSPEWKLSLCQIAFQSVQKSDRHTFIKLVWLFATNLDLLHIDVGRSHHQHHGIAWRLHDSCHQARMASHLGPLTERLNRLLAAAAFLLSDRRRKRDHCRSCFKLWTSDIGKGTNIPRNLNFEQGARIKKRPTVVIILRFDWLNADTERFHSLSIGPMQNLVGKGYKVGLFLIFAVFCTNLQQFRVADSRRVASRGTIGLNGKLI